MRFTYKCYLFKGELKKYKNDIEIIEEKKMSLGSIVTFYCDNKNILDEIFCEE